MGNLYSDTLDNILSSPPEYSVNSNVCKSCRYYRMCNGGCPGSGFQFTGKLGSPDPRCPKIYKKTPDLPLVYHSIKTI